MPSVYPYTRHLGGRKTVRLLCSLIALMVGTRVVSAGGEDAKALDPGAGALDSRSGRRIARIELNQLDKLSAHARQLVDRHFDPCAIDRETDGRAFAVLVCEPRELEALRRAGAVIEDSGPLTDHLARFAPANTLRRKQIPSIERLIPVDDAPPGRAVGLSCGAIGTSLQPYSEYHNWDEGVCFLRNLAAAYPEIARLESIGRSLEGRDIWALKLTSEPDRPTDQKPGILFTGMTHAREWATHELILYYAEYLTHGYATDPMARKILDKCVVWLVPVVNPDGFVFSWSDDRFWRKNRRENPNTQCEGVDLNRNFSYGWGADASGSSSVACAETFRGPSAASEPETQALSELLRKERFTIAISYHSYSQLLTFPWAYTIFQTPESYTSMRALAGKYARVAKTAGGQSYLSGQTSYTIYRSNGDFEDHAYGEHGALAFTCEVRPTTTALGGFLLPESQILPNNREHLAGALWMMENLADNLVVHHPYSPTILEEPVPGALCAFSPSLPALNQRPDVAFGLPASASSMLTTRLNDAVRFPPYDGTFLTDFEACGAGRGYRFQITQEPQTLQWPAGFKSMRVLPRSFEDGAEVMLSNVGPDINLIGVPCAHPIRLRDVRIIKRRITPASSDFGFAESIMEQRTAQQDLVSPTPWVNWKWKYTDPIGRVRYSHPTGQGRADTFVWPFRAYEVTVNVPSWQFSGTSINTAVYLLSFPGTSADCDRNGRYDADDLLAGGFIDCNANLAPDACEPAARDTVLFVSSLLAPVQDVSVACLFDVNQDGACNGDDIQGFIARLLAP